VVRDVSNPTEETIRGSNLRKRLVEATLEWERHFGVAPHITSAISEFDAAMLVGMPEDAYCADGKTRTAVTKDTDFIWNGIRYQVSANRPSGKKGSPVTWVARKHEEKRPFGWDRFIWLLYDKHYVIQEAWEFSVEEYRSKFKQLKRLSPDHMRLGHCLLSPGQEKSRDYRK